MVILGLDPGDTTGYGIVDQKGTLLGKGSFSLDAMSFWMRHIRDVWHVTHIILESPPHKVQDAQPAWHMIRTELKIMFPKIVVYESGPGLWKPMRQALLRPGDRFQSDHEKDATHLARFRLRQLVAQGNRT